MGFFSWKTLDTDTSIPNRYSERPTFTVTLMDNQGNKWTESEYEGYGEFNGKDYYELLAEMNGQETRDDGISIAFDESRGVHNTLYPNIVFDENHEWKNLKNEDCEFQGYFY